MGAPPVTDFLLHTEPFTAPIHSHPTDSLSIHSPFIKPLSVQLQFPQVPPAFPLARAPPQCLRARSSCDSAAMLEAVLHPLVSVSFLCWFVPPRSWPSFQQAVRSTGEELFPSGADASQFSRGRFNLSDSQFQDKTAVCTAGLWLLHPCCTGTHSCVSHCHWAAYHSTNQQLPLLGR